MEPNTGVTIGRYTYMKGVPYYKGGMGIIHVSESFSCTSLGQSLLAVSVFLSV